MIGQGLAPDPSAEMTRRPDLVGRLSACSVRSSAFRLAAAGSLEKALARPCAAPIKRGQAGTKEGRSPAEQRKRKRESLLMKKALDDSPHRSLFD
jgi:hypothetical protein